MIDGLDKAKLAIQRQVSREIDWFVPPGERHFDPASVVLAFAGLLLTSFLAGFTKAAKKAAEDAGEQVFQWLAKQAKDILSGRQQQEKKNGLDKLAAEAPALARALDRDDLMLYVKKVEEGLRLYLETSLPPDRAVALATDVRNAALTHVLK